MIVINILILYVIVNGVFLFSYFEHESQDGSHKVVCYIHHNRRKFPTRNVAAGFN